MRCIPWLLIGILLNACEIVSEVDLDDPVNRALLIKSWQVKEVSVDGIQDNFTDYQQFLLTLNDDDTYLLIDQFGNEFSGKWSMEDSQKQIILRGDDEEIVFTLQDLKSDELTILLVVENLKGFPVEYQFTLESAA